MHFSAAEWLITATWLFTQLLLYVCALYSPAKREKIEVAVYNRQKAI